ncbi:MAG: hypothetical protein ACFCBU_10250, partial [Cyanophyceae cyanobacterium]
MAPKRSVQGMQISSPNGSVKALERLNISFWQLSGYPFDSFLPLFFIIKYIIGVVYLLIQYGIL